MKYFLFCIVLSLSFKSQSTSVAFCSISVKVVDHKLDKNCGKSIETHCDNVALIGLKFPKGTTLVYSCNFNDMPREPIQILRAELSDKIKFEKDFISGKSELHFAQGQLYMITFGEKQKFRGHVYGAGVSASFNLKNGKPASVYANLPFQFDDANYKYINFAPNGDLVGFELSNDADVLGFPIKSKEAISLRDGAYSQIVLSKPHAIGRWTFDGKLTFHKNGKPQSGSLANVHIFEKAKLKGPVQFNEKGDLVMGTLAENVVRVYDPATCGTLFLKAGNPVGFGDEGARLWTKWYPEDKPNNCTPPSQEMLKRMFPSVEN